MKYPTAEELIASGYTLEPLWIGTVAIRNWNELSLSAHTLPADASSAPNKRSGLATGITRVKKKGKTYLYARRKRLPDGYRPQKWFADTEEGLAQALEWREQIEMPCYEMEPTP